MPSSLAYRIHSSITNTDINTFDYNFNLAFGTDTVCYNMKGSWKKTL